MAKRRSEELFWSFGAELRTLSEELGAGRPSMAKACTWEPRIDLIEEDRRFLLKAEVAGLRGDDFQVHYHPDRHSIILRGVREEESWTEGARTGTHQLEIFYGDFQREIRLPDVAIDADNVRATYRNGFLLIMIPKRPGTIRRRNISIRSE